ncbi:hypothetical protein [Halalkalibacter krulwichiae]|uniref:Uncharacterized protein n=1 Tax=Halalkalibacter krulwichiae TaxID=199441 RepID=A0A1X9MLH1_9BACI|nr:hypothetical protein [Halalkalibacter krulwichiae]ARK32711.1 hypothetical protein BkAM31D_24215 [Halalkalibacter krulwichiae]
MVEQYQMKEIIIDHHFIGEESITADFTYNKQDYSVTFHKSDLEVLNMWVLKEGTSLPANLSDELIHALREEVQQRM